MDRQVLLHPTLLGPFKPRQPPLWHSLLTASANRPILVKVTDCRLLVLYLNTGVMLQALCSHCGPTVQPLLKHIKGTAASVCLHLAPVTEIDCLVQGTSRQTVVKEEEKERLFSANQLCCTNVPGLSVIWSKTSVPSDHHV